MFGNFPPCLAFTMRPENDGGPFHIDPNDPGGATKWGITISTLTEWRRETGAGSTTVDNLKNLEEWERDAIYATNYWDRVNADHLPFGVDLMVFDFGVTCGATISARALQRALGFVGHDIDGWIGPHTIAAIGKTNAFKLIADVADLQLAYYEACLDAPKYLHGWERRLDDRRRLAVGMLNSAHSARVNVTTAP